MTDNINPNFPRGVEVVVGVIIENPQGQILLVKSPKWSNKWTIPGGHIDPGETIMQTAIREAKEEAGLACEPVNVFNHGEALSTPDFHRPAHFIYFTAHCQCQNDKVTLDGAELTEYVWMRPEEARNLALRGGFGNTIQKFIDYKKSLR